MFNLNEQIQSWRTSLPGDLAERRELLDELESHLRDDFDRLVATGQSPQEAWSAALRHLGDPQSLAREFARVAKPFWLPIWTVSLTLIFAMAALEFVVTSQALRGRLTPLLASHISTLTLGYLSLLAVGFLALWAVIVRAISNWNAQQTNAFRTAGRRLTLLAALANAVGLFLGALWSHQALHRWWSWTPREIGFLCVLAWSALLFQSFRSRTQTPSSLLPLSIIANIVVCLSWFGPFFISSTVGNTQSLPILLLTLFLTIHFLAIHLSLLPPAALRPKHSQPD